MKWSKQSMVLMLVMLLLILSACSSNSTGNNEGSQSTNTPANTSEATKAVVDEKPITLTWSGWSAEEEATKPAIESMINSWNAENPNATVKWVGWPWANTREQLIIRSQANDQMDVAQSEFSWLGALNSANALLDLSTVFDEAWLNENFEQSALEVAKVDGKQVALPWTLASVGMVFNPSLLEKAGVTEVPATIAEFEDALSKLKASNPELIPYALETKNVDFVAWLWTFGGKVFDENENVTINSPEGVATLEWMKSLLDHGYIRMDLSRFDARELYAKDLVGFYDDAIFTKGTLAAAGVAEAELDNKIQPMLRPVLKAGDTPRSTLWGHTLIINKKSSNPEKAAEFIKHIVSDEQALNYFESNGMLPVSKSALNTDQVKNDAWSNKWAEITKFGQKNETANYDNGSELNGIIRDEVQAALLGGKTAQKALDDAAAKLKTAISN